MSKYNFVKFGSLLIFLVLIVVAIMSWVDTGTDHNLITMLCFLFSTPFGWIAFFSFKNDHDDDKQ